MGFTKGGTFTDAVRRKQGAPTGQLGVRPGASAGFMLESGKGGGNEAFLKRLRPTKGIETAGPAPGAPAAPFQPQIETAGPNPFTPPPPETGGVAGEQTNFDLDAIKGSLQRPGKREQFGESFRGDPPSMGKPMELAGGVQTGGNMFGKMIGGVEVGGGRTGSDRSQARNRRRGPFQPTIQTAQ